MSRKQRGVPIHGWINLDKPLGMSSAKAVAIVKALTNAQKVGHAGTLDPLAEGILPIALGEATKTSAYMMDATKDYRFTLAFGEATTTDDREGEACERSEFRPSEAEIKAILPQFIGEISQLPPAFSAIKIAGKRAYELARAGEVVEMKARNVRIIDLQLIEYHKDYSVFWVCCGKGTYIRSLARDMAVALGSVGFMAKLRRCRVGAFDEARAISLDLLEKTVHSPATFSDESLKEYVLPLSVALDDIPAIRVDAAAATALKQGQAIEARGFPDAPMIAAMEGEKLIALCSRQGQHFLPKRVFNL